MNSAHADVKGNASAYVLDALDESERIAFEAHLATCSECAAEVVALRGARNALAHAVPQRTPRPELRARVLASFAAGTAQAPPGDPGVAHGATQGAVRGDSRSWIPIAAALALATGLGVYAFLLQDRVDDLQASAEVIAAPDVVRIDLAGQPTAPQSSGRAHWSRERGMVFATSNLPPAPAGKVYQVWVVTAQAPISAGLVTPDPAGGGVTYFSTPIDIPPPTAVAVTLEPAGGVPAPTGEFYLVGKPGV